jgi:hypothetical protein
MTVGTALTLLANGNIGFGNTAPAVPLHSTAPSTTAYSLTWGATTGQILRNEASEFAFGLHNASPYPLYIQGRTSSSTARDIILNPSGGQVGIGATSPAATLAVSGVIAQQYAGTGMPFPIQPMLTAPAGKTKVTFSCTGADQSFTVPAGITAILVKLWGAGGGGGNSGGWSSGSRGGGGGHTIGIIPCTPGQVFYIVVGQGGQTNYSGGQTRNYGGGGTFYNNGDNRYSGAGGGYTGIFTSSGIAQGNAILIAGGGGGGGCSRMRDGNWGGAGGGLNGEGGNAAYDGRYSYAGTGGTQSGGGTNAINSGNNGGALVGGYGRWGNNPYGGGGGSGYYGGAGGDYVESNTMAGAGGGSGYVNSSLTQFGATFTGSQWRPAMHNDNDLPKTYDGYNNWAHYAMGGDFAISGGQYTSMGGGSGFCCIYY